MSDRQRIKALELSIGRLRQDLQRVNLMLGLAPTKPALKKQKAAIEKIVAQALIEISTLRKRGRERSN